MGRLVHLADGAETVIPDGRWQPLNHRPRIVCLDAGPNGPDADYGDWIGESSAAPEPGAK